MEAWNEPKFICIERSSEDAYESMKKVPWCWHPSAAKYAFNRLADAREEFFTKYQPPLLRIVYEAMKAEPERVITELCNFLQHVPSPQQRQNALTLIRETNDDCCLSKENNNQSVQTNRMASSNQLRSPHDSSLERCITEMFLEKSQELPYAKGNVHTTPVKRNAKTQKEQALIRTDVS